MENHHFGVGNDDKREQFIALPIANGMMKKAIGKWMKGGCVMEAPASSYQSRFSVTVCDKKNILSKHHSEDGCCLPIQGATIAASVWALPNLSDEGFTIGFLADHDTLSWLHHANNDPISSSEQTIHLPLLAAECRQPLEHEGIRTLFVPSTVAVMPLRMPTINTHPDADQVLQQYK
ncbi:uncharacterized protein MONOS_9938 [Monocercomonoides exilis]|uniref:uncharacterized protein n=1 Tax=Monocercomonoides exilis TaxID=2049356 RepID=UPI00355A208B|nr:hypothetical protein MONOS_9938 [Monocercomonoides exilis]|eukprot:MONOS_9938.1-p1 / transcript=MONOS_9938.1 / gene=MONOS_9938 / organism=Monocercomonoides_exilis_PA203 / gene_product=unspecified product / transcript_product=unspecified product / location=Mono_scaffold00429:28137-28985(-) / protein_length=177 / sequence_SO=supercontig / SO=protein_coding / is_pseudo=false